MKQSIFLISIFWIIPLCAACTREEFYTDFCKDAYAKSYMFTHPVTYDVAQYEALWHRITHTDPHAEPYCNAVQTYGFIQRSVYRRSNNYYFSAHRKNVLLVAGDEVCPERNTRDVRAEWLNLPNNFLGTMNFCLTQKQQGCLFAFHHDLGRYSDFFLVRDSWIEIRFPLINMSNNLHLQQCIIQNAKPSYCETDNLITAFNQPSWCFSKINGPRRYTGLGDIRIDWGRTVLAQNFFEIGYYGSFLIPTGNKQNPTWIFDTVTGSNRHAALGGGIFFQLPVVHDRDRIVCCFFINLEALYLFKNTQHRTYDLKCKPWSRFLLYNYEQGPPDQNIPGVNLLTLKSLVRPYCFSDFMCGWRIITQHFEGEAGFGIWGRPTERLRLLCDDNNPFERPFGIAGNGPSNPQEPISCQTATSANNSTIEQQSANDPVFVRIGLHDIDLFSAAAEKTLNYKVHIAGGYISPFDCNFVIFTSIGFDVEIPNRNASLSQWTTSIKLGASF